MNKLAQGINKVKIWYQTNKFDIAAVFIIILMVTLIFGLWRLEKVRLEKEPIQLSHNISFATFI